MRANMKELSIFVLLMLLSLSEGKPLRQRVRRAIVKDYFNPLTYPTDKLQFEKGEDGKYHEQRPVDPTLSKVEYAMAHAIDASNEIFGEALDSSDKTLKDEDAIVVNTENTDLSPGVSKVEFQKESIDISSKISADGEKDKTKAKEEVPETTTKLDFEATAEDAANKEYETSAKLDIPVDSKWSLVPKPDGKDDKPYEGGEDYVPEPPISPEEKFDEGKVEIGEIPKRHPVFVPPNLPLLFPRRFSFRMLSLLPKPPTIDISDRLPLPQPEVIEESSETAVVENISPRGPMVIKEEKRFFSNHHLTNPLRFGLQLPFLPFTKVLKDTVDEEKFKGLVKSEVVDIGGRKMLLRKKFLIAPDNDPSHFQISVMSIQPLEEVDPDILKELDTEEKELESEETSFEKGLKFDGKKEAEKRSLKDAVVDKAAEEEVEKRPLKDVAVERTMKEEGKKATQELPKLTPEAEILDAEKTEEIEEKAVDGKMSPPEVSGHVFPAVEIAKETSEKEEKEYELESKVKDLDIEESHATEESGMKTELKIESKPKANVEKGKGMEIPSIIPEEKIEEVKTTSVVIKKDEDVLIGTEDLLKFRSQVRSQNPTTVHPLITEVKVDDMKGEFEFEDESQTQDEEAAQSRRVEVTLKPVLESKFNFEKVNPEGKKGDEGMLDAEEVVPSYSETELAASKNTKEQTDILKVESKDLEKIMPEEGLEKAADSHILTGITMRKDAKENTDDMKLESTGLHEESRKDAEEKIDVTKIKSTEIHEEPRKDAKEKSDVMKIEPTELHEESKTEGKKGDDEVLSAEEDLASHGAIEATASKSAKGKIDIRNLQRTEESSRKIEDFGLTKSEGALLEERKKKFEERKDKTVPKKKKCKCEDSDDSDSDDEDDID